MRTNLLATLLLASALLISLVPAASAVKLNRDVVDPPTHVCLQSNQDCHFLPHTGRSGNLCLSGYDDNNDGWSYSYACLRPLGACALESSRDGYGQTCVVLLWTDDGGDLCAVGYAPWEGSGYGGFVCVGAVE
jgi:hypothetical protein